MYSLGAVPTTYASLSLDTRHITRYLGLSGAGKGVLHAEARALILAGEFQALARSGWLVLGFLWTCSGLALGLLWACSGLALGLLLACSGMALGLLWACSGLALGWLWTGSGLAREFPPCTAPINKFLCCPPRCEAILPPQLGTFRDLRSLCLYNYGFNDLGSKK